MYVDSSQYFIGSILIDTIKQSLFVNFFIIRNNFCSILAKAIKTILSIALQLAKSNIKKSFKIGIKYLGLNRTK
jgi:hypothetical protein